MEKNLYDEYLNILNDELIPAMGCTEPIAVAYAGALARKTLGCIPDTVVLTVSGSIIKNVKSVVVPNTGGRVGLRIAVSAGIVAGDSDAELEVISQVTPEALEEVDDFEKNKEIIIKKSNAKCSFDIQVLLKAGDEESYVRIIGQHTNVVLIKKNNTVIFGKEFEDEAVPAPENRKLLSVEKIVEFANEVDINDVKEVIGRQISYNMAIAKAGLKEHYGANIGKILLESYGDGVHNRAKAYAAAGSDARMNGCELPVIINSGSGNQGITTSVPVIIYSKCMDYSEEELYRALVVSNLITIHLKTGIGSLSAYCGATSAGAGAAAGICYLNGGRNKDIAHTVVNTIAINSGMICDGAKASCAAKIASAIEAGFLGLNMYRNQSQFTGGDGIVAKGVENTIEAVGKLARDGMKETDIEIIKLMLDN